MGKGHGETSLQGHIQLPGCTRDRAQHLGAGQNQDGNLSQFAFHGNGCCGNQCFENSKLGPCTCAEVRGKQCHCCGIRKTVPQEPDKSHVTCSSTLSVHPKDPKAGLEEIQISGPSRACHNCQGMEAAQLFANEWLCN